MDADLKRRFSMFGTGAVVGTIASIILFQFWNASERPDNSERADVVLTTCELSSGDILKKECVEIREGVAVQFLPPDVLYSKEVEWHIGKTLLVDVTKGNALRTVDFKP